MVILDATQKEQQLLIKLIENSSIAPWVKKSLIGRLQDDIDRIEKMKACEHEYAQFKGVKQCCKWCEAHPIGGGFEWQYEKDIDKDGA